jgi:tetratricopeptide (TPR) repeat protein
LEIPGYELASAMTVAMALFSGLSGVVSAQKERLMLTKERSFTSSYSSWQVAFWSFAASSLVGLLVLTPTFLVATLKTIFFSPCSPWSGALFYLILPVPTVLLASAAGIFLGFATRNIWSAMLMYLLLLGISLGVSIWPLWRGPQVFALNHFFGYFPGPLYDESLPIDYRLVVFRVFTFLWVALLLLITSLLLDPAKGKLPGNKAAFLKLWPWLIILSASLLAGWLFNTQLGLSTTHTSLAQELSGTTQTSHFVLHFSPSKPAEEVERLKRDIEFSYFQVASCLGSEPSVKMHAWFYLDAKQKRRLVGASETSFAKPWNGEFHVLDEPFPHPLIRHEMTHMMAATFGSPVLRVSSRGSAIHMGIVEGLAVACESPGLTGTLHEKAAAMRRLQLAPDIRSLMEPTGFYSQAQSKAYIIAGSFIRFLRERYGAASLRLLYPKGDFVAAYGKDLPNLATEWEHFIDSLPVDTLTLAATRALASRPSLFEKPCARELAMCKSKAKKAAISSPQAAAILYEQCSQLDPSNPTYFLEQANLYQSTGNSDKAKMLYQKILSMPQLTTIAKAQAITSLGEIAWKNGNLEQAKSHWEEARKVHYDRSALRLIAIQLEALSESSLQPVWREFFAHPQSLPAALALERWNQEQPKNSITRYLLGRQLYLQREWKDAAKYLNEARNLQMVNPEVARENLRLLSLSHYLSGNLDDALQAMEEMLTMGNATDKEYALDWISRYQFEKKI